MFYVLSRGFFRCLLKIIAGLRVIGRENVPASGGVILAPNHISYLDPPVCGAGTSRQTRFMAKAELFRPPLGYWVRAMGAFPVRRGSADRKAIKTALDYLANGELICLFPEGTRSPDGKLQEPELGVGMIAMKSRAPIVPVAIIGTDKVLPIHSKFLHFARITIVYGKPITFDDLYDSKDTRMAFEEIGRRIMSGIAELQAKYDPEYVTADTI